MGGSIGGIRHPKLGQTVNATPRWGDGSRSASCQVCEIPVLGSSGVRIVALCDTGDTMDRMHERAENATYGQGLCRNTMVHQVGCCDGLSHYLAMWQVRKSAAEGM